MFLKPNAPKGVFIASGFPALRHLLQLFPSLSICLSSTGHSPLNSLLSEFQSCAQAHCSSWGHENVSMARLRCSMPAPCSCRCCASLEVLWISADPQGYCPGLGGIKGKKLWRAKGQSQYKHTKENRFFSYQFLCLEAA